MHTTDIIHGYDDAAYYLDHARERCETGDLMRASDAARAAAHALGSRTNPANYATAAARALAEAPPDPDRAARYLALAAQDVEMLLTHGRADVD
jgi:hypothetical protein